MNFLQCVLLWITNPVISLLKSLILLTIVYFRATSPLSGSSHVEDNLSDIDELETPKVEPTEDNITFQIIVGGSLRGKCKLKDSLGYSYTLKVQYHMLKIVHMYVRFEYIFL